MDLFELNTAALVAMLVVVVGGAIVVGHQIGRRIRARVPANSEPLGVVQGALLGLVGLLLAFGLSMAVGRYEARRTLVVQEANDIGTAYLRAQLLDEPERSTSMRLLTRYADAAVMLAEETPDTAGAHAASRRMERLTDGLWSTARRSVDRRPADSAPRLYVEALNPMLDTHTSRVASLRDRVPGAVMVLLVVGGAIAVGVLALYLALVGRGPASSVVTGLLVIVILFVSFDLDRPQRGFITVPATALQQQRQSMTAR